MSWSASTSTRVSDGIQRRGAAIRGEWNVLLNPAHADFPKIKAVKRSHSSLTVECPVSPKIPGLCAMCARAEGQGIEPLSAERSVETKGRDQGEHRG